MLFGCGVKKGGKLYSRGNSKVEVDGVDVNEPGLGSEDDVGTAARVGVEVEGRDIVGEYEDGR